MECIGGSGQVIKLKEVVEDLDLLRRKKKYRHAHESISEAPMATRATLKQLGSELNKASDIIIKITDKYKKKADVDGMVTAWMRGLHLRLKKSGVKI